jgi:hypothetical protein
MRSHRRPAGRLPLSSLFLGQRAEPLIPSRGPQRSFREHSLPDLRVVSERSSEEIKKQTATLAFKFALVNLTANLIRIVRGGGKPDRLFDDIDGFVGAYKDYCIAFEHAPDGAVLRALLRFNPDQGPDDDGLDEALLENAICRDALQIVASSLVDHSVQREKALGELQHHLRRFVDVRERAKKRRGRTRKLETRRRSD